jgi:hypothetical protein
MSETGRSAILALAEVKAIIVLVFAFVDNDDGAFLVLMLWRNDANLNRFGTGLNDDHSRRWLGLHPRV